MRDLPPSADQEKKFSDPGTLRIGIVVAEWNQEITEALLEGAVQELKGAGLGEENLVINRVPGSFEIPYGVQRQLTGDSPDAVLALGSLIRGATTHFDVIAHSVAHTLQELSIRFSTPVLFGVLTDENMDQARERAGGSKGNKGQEAALAAMRLLSDQNFHSSTFSPS
ncbi:MAG: 6,7-dimethyl-8-ribityllumazine synthase [Flavobacteriales bacterium]